MIINYCNADKLKELALNSEFDYFTSRQLSQFAPVFRHLRKLTVSGTHTISKISGLLSLNKNLSALHLKYVKLDKFLENDLLLKLTELTIENCTIDCSELKMYFISNQNLKAFNFKLDKCRFCKDTLDIITTITEHLPNVEKLSIEIDCVYKDRNQHNNLLISELPKLKALKIFSTERDCVDVYPLLKRLAAKNSIEELTIVIAISHISRRYFDYQFAEFPYFTSLRSLQIINPIRVAQDFLYHLVSKSPNLTKIIFRSSYPISKTMVVSVARHVQHLELLILDSPKININNIYAQIYDHFILTKHSAVEFCVTKDQSRTFFKAKCPYYPKVLRITYLLEE